MKGSPDIAGRAFALPPQNRGAADRVSIARSHHALDNAQVGVITICRPRAITPAASNFGDHARNESTFMASATYSEGRSSAPSSTAGELQSPSVQRISWSAIFAGVVVAVAETAGRW